MTDPTELRRLAEAATPGEWRAIDGDIWVLSDTDYPTYPIFDDSRRRQKSWTNRPSRAESDANAAYIAKMHPGTTLALLDRLAELEAIVAKVRGGVSARSNLCAAMAQWLANQQHWTDLPDDHAVLESRGTEGEFCITAGMIREANR